MMGCIKINTDILHSDAFKTNTSKLVWFCLMRDADDSNHVETSARAIAKEIGVDEKTVRNVFKALAADSIIEIESPILSPILSPQKVRYKGCVIKLNDITTYGVKRKTQVRKKSDITSDIKSDISTSPQDGFSRFRDYFNNAVDNTSIPQITKLTDARKNALRSIFKEYGKDTVETVIQKVIASDFLAREWGKVSFDWIFKKSNFIKILEGNYDNRTTNKQATDKYSARRGTDVGDHTEADYGGPF